MDQFRLRVLSVVGMATSIWLALWLTRLVPVCGRRPATTFFLCVAATALVLRVARRHAAPTPRNRNGFLGLAILLLAGVVFDGFGPALTPERLLSGAIDMTVCLAGGLVLSELGLSFDAGPRHTTLSLNSATTNNGDAAATIHK